MLSWRSLPGSFAEKFRVQLGCFSRRLGTSASVRVQRNHRGNTCRTRDECSLCPRARYSSGYPLSPPPSTSPSCPPFLHLAQTLASLHATAPSPLSSLTFLSYQCNACTKDDKEKRRTAMSHVANKREISDRVCRLTGQNQ